MPARPFPSNLTSSSRNCYFSLMTDDIEKTLRREASTATWKTVGFSYFVVIHGEHLGKRFPMKDEPMLIGRVPDCQIRFSDPNVSRKHCNVIPDGPAAILQDLDSTNGIYVNGEKKSVWVLKNGDQVGIGRSILKFLTGDKVEYSYHEEIHRFMTVDNLTGAYNRKHFDDESENMFSLFKRYNLPISLILMGLDNAKTIIDTLGPIAGDRLLSHFSKVLIQGIRKNDLFCCFDANRFALLMPGTGLSGSLIKAQKILATIADKPFVFEDKTVPIMFSLGAAEFTETMKVPGEIILAVEKNLRAARAGGGNRVEPQSDSS